MANKYYASLSGEECIMLVEKIDNLWKVRRAVVNCDGIEFGYSLINQDCIDSDFTVIDKEDVPFIEGMFKTNL